MLASAYYAGRMYYKLLCNRGLDDFSFLSDIDSYFGSRYFCELKKFLNR